jgi:hypothetical protein
MVRPSTSMVGKAVSHTSLTLGGAGGGWLVALIADAKTKTVLLIAAVAGALIANGLTRVIESIYKRRPQTIKAKGEKKARIIVAKSEGEALIVRTQARAELLLAALDSDPDKAERAAEMLRLEPLNADLPPDRRLKDEILAKLLTAPKARNGRRGRPGSGGGPQNGQSGGDGSGGIVRPIRGANTE